ncbi:MAG: dockerin type I domain-containing protein [Planctomycetota bacterium]
MACPSAAERSGAERGLSAAWLRGTAYPRNVLLGVAVTVTSPDGGEVLLASATAPITWSTEGSVMSNVAIAYSGSGGGTWSTITSSTPNDGNYPWVVPSAPTMQGMIRVTATDSCGQPVEGVSGLFSIVTSCDDGIPCTLDAFVPSLGRCLNLPTDCFACPNGDEDCRALPVPCLDCVQGHCVPALRLCNQRPEQCKYKFYDCITGYCMAIDWCEEGLCCQDGECQEPPCEHDQVQALVLDVLEGGLDWAYDQILDQHEITTSTPGLPGFVTGMLHLSSWRTPWAYLAFEYQYLDPSPTELATLTFGDALLWVAPEDTGPDVWERAVVPIGDYAVMTAALTFTLLEGAEPAANDTLKIRGLRLLAGATLDSIPGDMDADGDLDMADVAGFISCLTGPGGGVPPGCAPGDEEPDADVDLADFALIQTVFSMTGSPVAALVQAAPAPDGTLWRTANNVVRLTFGADITAPSPGQVRIQQLLPDGDFGAELSTNGFTFAVETIDVEGVQRPRVLRIRENGTQLTDRTWIALRNVGSTGGWTGVGPFEVQYVVLMGDVNDDGWVQNADASAVYPHVSFLPVPDDNPYDVNGDGYVQNADVSAIYPRISFLPKPPKPSGH